MWDLKQYFDFWLVSEFWKRRISDKNQFPFPAHMNVLGEPKLCHSAFLIFNNSMETRFLSCLPPICLCSFSIHCFSILCVGCFAQSHRMHELPMKFCRAVLNHIWLNKISMASVQCRKVFILPYGTRKKCAIRSGPCGPLSATYDKGVGFFNAKKKNFARENLRRA